MSDENGLSERANHTVNNAETCASGDTDLTQACSPHVPAEWLHRLSRHKHKDARRLAQQLGRYERSDAGYRSALRPIMLRQIDELAAELSVCQ